MDIQIALDSLSGTNITLQKQIDANNLAISILKNTFEAEFTSRDTALQQASQAIALNGEKDATISNLTTRAETAEQAATDLQAEKEALNATVTEKNTQITDLTDEKTALTKSLDDATVALADKDAQIVSLQTLLDDKGQVDPATP